MPLSKQQLGSLLWGIADTGLRGKVEDYKAYILSLLFFKRLSDNYEWETEKRVTQFRDQYGKEPNQKPNRRPVLHAARSPRHHHPFYSTAAGLHILRSDRRLGWLRE